MDGGRVRSLNDADGGHQIMVHQNPIGRPDLRSPPVFSISSFFLIRLER